MTPQALLCIFLLMKKSKSERLEPLPRVAYVVIAVMGAILLVLVLVAGRFYLANWRGDAVFLPVALFLGLLLIAAVAKWLTNKH